MKKSIILMAGLMAMALVGSAQAGNTMFAVQNGTVDKFVVQDDGKVGVGTATPTGASLHVVATDVAILNDVLGANVSAGMGVDVSTPVTAPPAGAIQAASYSFLANYTNGGLGVSNNFNTFRMVSRIGSAENYTGQFAAANFQAQHQGTGTASYVVGFITNTAVRNSGNIIDAVAVDAAGPGKLTGATGVVTNAKGLRIRQQKGTPTGATVTNGYGIYQEGTQDVNFFAGLLNAPNLPIFADNTAAASLSAGTLYRTATGVVMVKF